MSSILWCGILISWALFCVWNIDQLSSVLCVEYWSGELNSVVWNFDQVNSILWCEYLSGELYSVVSNVDQVSFICGVECGVNSILWCRMLIRWALLVWNDTRWALLCLGNVDPVSSIVSECYHMNFILKCGTLRWALSCIMEYWSDELFCVVRNAENVSSILWYRMLIKWALFYGMESRSGQLFSVVWNVHHLSFIAWCGMSTRWTILCGVEYSYVELYFVVLNVDQVSFMLNICICWQKNSNSILWISTPGQVWP